MEVAPQPVAPPLRRSTLVWLLLYAALACWITIELTPVAFGERLFGEAFSSALPLTRILAVAGMLAGAGLGIQVTLRARGLLARTVRIRVATGLLALAAAPFAIALSGAEGAAGIYAIMSALVFAGCMALTVKSTREGESGLRI